MILNAFFLLKRLLFRLYMVGLRYAFRRCGKNVIFDPFGYYSFHTIEIGDDVFIGPGAFLGSSKSGIVFGSKIMLGPNVTILGGDHNTERIGSFMFDVKEKKPGDDLPVIIKDDVWIGAGAIILKGVTLERGVIVAAGAVVTRSVPPYAIVAGTPARILKFRFSPSEVIQHEKLLYPEGKRLELGFLQNCQGNLG